MARVYATAEGKIAGLVLAADEDTAKPPKGAARDVLFDEDENTIILHALYARPDDMAIDAKGRILLDGYPMRVLGDGPQRLAARQVRDTVTELERDESVSPAVRRLLALLVERVGLVPSSATSTYRASFRNEPKG